MKPDRQVKTEHGGRIRRRRVDPGRQETSARALTARIGPGGNKHLYRIDVGELLFGQKAPGQRLPLRAEILARQALDDNLAPDEFYVAWGLAAFVVYFNRKPAEVATLKCNLLTAEILRRIKAEAGRWQTADAAAPAPERRPEEAGATEPAPAAKARLPRERPVRARDRDWATRAMLLQLERREPRGGNPAIEAAADGGRAEFTPVWHVRNQIISAYVARLAPEEALAVARLVSAHPDAGLSAALDIRLLAAAIRPLDQLLVEQGRIVVIVPVSFMTVDQRATRDAYFAMCGRIFEATREVLVFELFDIPADLPQFRLHDKILELRRYCRAVLVRTGLDFRGSPTWHGLRTYAFGADLATEQGQERDWIEKFARFAQAAGRAGVHAYLHGVPTLSLAAAAVGAGFDYVAGEALAPPAAAPASAQPFDLGQLYVPLLQPGAVAADCPADCSPSGRPAGGRANLPDGADDQPSAGRSS